MKKLVLALSLIVSGLGQQALACGDCDCPCCEDGVCDPDCDCDCDCCDHDHNHAE